MPIQGVSCRAERISFSWEKVFCEALGVHCRVAIKSRLLACLSRIGPRARDGLQLFVWVVGGGGDLTNVPGEPGHVFHRRRGTETGVEWRLPHDLASQSLLLMVPEKVLHSIAWYW